MQWNSEFARLKQIGLPETGFRKFLGWEISERVAVRKLNETPEF